MPVDEKPPAMPGDIYFIKVNIYMIRLNYTTQCEKIIICELLPMCIKKRGVPSMIKHLSLYEMFK